MGSVSDLEMTDRPQAGDPAPSPAVVAPDGLRPFGAAPADDDHAGSETTDAPSSPSEIGKDKDDGLKVGVEDSFASAEPQAKKDPDTVFEEYPYLSHPLLNMKGPFGAFLRYFTLGPDVTNPKRGVVPEFDAEGNILLDGKPAPPPRRKSVISVASNKSATARPPWTRYDMYSKGWKTAIISVCGLTGVLGALTGSVFSPALTKMQAEFGVSDVMANLTLTVGILSLGIMPVFWSPLADLYGRRWVLLVSQIINAAGNIGCFFSPNIGVFLAMRIVSTGGAGAGLAVCSGCIVDIYRKEERGRAMGLYMLGSLIGPVVAPIIGGAVTQTLGWRYIFIVGCGLSMSVFALTFFLIPETLRGDPKKKARPNPLRAFYYIRYSFVAFPTVYSSISFMAFYTYPATVPRDFSRLYGFNAAAVGFVQMSLGFGMMFGSVFGGWMTDRAVNGWKSRRGVYVQEDRLRSATVGMVCNVTGLLLYGWAVQSQLPWPVPALGMIFTGYGQMIVGATIGTYMIDVFYFEASSITAMSNCTRFIMGSIAPLIAAPGYATMGPGGFYTLLAGLASIFALGIAYVVVFGTRARVSRKPWSENANAGKQLAAVEKTRGTGWLSRTVGRGRSAGDAAAAEAAVAAAEEK
ncbi:major facilitator superfamily domain-containing protein [Hyaloraphidium curvatum]|nr:major facilitator superfamily domain-containing protein [Hyaloraphidium curvatum]